MKKDIYDLLNNTKTNIDEYKIEELNEIEKRKMKNKIKKSIKKPKNTKKIAIAAAFSCILMGGFLTTDAGAEVIEYLNKFKVSIQSSLNLNDNIEDYTSVINKEVTKNGATIKLDEVVLTKGIFDDKEKINEPQLIVSSLINLGEISKETSIRIFPEIYIDGKEVNKGSSGSTKLREDGLVEACGTYDIENVDIDRELKIKLVYKDITTAYLNSDGKEVVKTFKGPFKFEFKVDGRKLLSETKEIDTNITLNNDDNEFKINKFVYNPVTQYFICENSEDRERNGEYKGYQIEGIDDLGNKISFSPYRKRGNIQMFSIDNIYGTMNMDAKSLTLQLRDCGKNKLVGEPFTIKLK